MNFSEHLKGLWHLCHHGLVGIGLSIVCLLGLHWQANICANISCFISASDIYYICKPGYNQFDLAQ